MANIVTIIIIVFTLAYVFFHLDSGGRKSVTDTAHEWWYIPWFALVYTGLMYTLYNKTNFPEWPVVRNITEEYKVEGVFFLFCAAIWTVLECIVFRNPFFHKKLIVRFRQLFAGKREDKDRMLPFPYYIDEEGKVRAKVGQVFYRWTMKTFILIILSVYMVFYILNAYANIDFYIISGLGLLGLLPLVDYYVYLCSEVPVEQKVVGGGKTTNYSDFDELWRLYTETFDNYSVAWKRTLNEKELATNKANVVYNDDNWDNIIKKFSENRMDGIVMNCDLVTAFMKMEPVFDHVEKNGRYVLVAIDVPDHFKRNENKTYVDEIAEKLRTIIKKDIFVYGGKSSVEELNNSVVLAPLSLVSDHGLYKEWMEKVGLIVVVNIFDKNISNMYECRRFSYVLRMANPDYQLLFITPFCREIQPSIANSWLTSTETPLEKNMMQFPYSDRQFFIGYNYEDYNERVEKILISRPPEPLYSGGELAYIALSSTAEGHDKAITPIHYLELAYTNAVESKEEVGVFTYLLDKTYQVAAKDINENIYNHMLPVERIEEDQILNVIYDRDNNAPAMYAKWQHLGIDENFSIVISKPYLFRDYFNANHSFFVTAPFIAIQPSLSKSKITLAIVLLKLLQNAEMEEKELCDILLFYYDSSEIKSVSTLIKELFSTYFTKDLARSLITEDVVAFDGEKYEHHIKYKLPLYGDNDQRFLDMVTVKDESGNELFDILRDLMEQNYVSGQIHTFSGRPYQIKDYNSRTKTLNVSKVNNSDKDVVFYKPSMEIKIHGDRTPIKEMNPLELKPKVWRHRITDQELSIVFDGFETNVEVVTTDWFEFSKYSLYGCIKTGSTTRPRNYSNGKVLKVSFKYPLKPQYLERIDDIRKGLQILFYEAMPSVFPHHSQYLRIASIGECDKDLPWIFNRLDCEDPVEKGVLSYYFIEDAHIDLGLIGVLSKPESIWYIFQYLYDYLIWLTEGNLVYPEGFDAYLNRDGLDKFSFLKYGRSSLPSYFDVELLINFIRDFFENSDEWKPISKDRQTKLDSMGICDFCRKEMKNSEMTRLSDGRMRCPDCSADAIDTDKQFRPLCEKAKELFKSYLDIDFSTIPHDARLISAVELHKIDGAEFHITNGYDARKILGLAWDKQKDVFYVENGRKPDQTLEIIVHEMTHIWEYQDPGFAKVRATNEDWVEGLAVWTELYLMEKYGLDREDARQSWLERDDEYGRGLKHIMKICPDNPYKYIKSVSKI